ncbi:hypothetical protein Btru_046613 [Bulinus truncatus]|nr:hypothetical protein Btru_046613 [Bulinus truncatus]
MSSLHRAQKTDRAHIDRTLKEDLRLSIIARRQAKGQQQIKVEFKSPEKIELSPEELMKKERRREQNRRAAQRCRTKKRLTQCNVLHGLDLIRYLKYYTRCTAPSEIEIRLCKKEVECEDLAGVLPEISASRLPFHLLRSNNKSKIVTSEMKLQTLTYWLNMAPVIDYKKDTIIGNAVANVMESYLQSTPVNPSSPRVSSEFFAVASQVESILERMEDRQYPVFCCHSLVGRLRHVGEITLTLKVSISYAEKWLSSASEKDEKKARVFIDQLRKELKTSSSKWALQKIGLHHDAELNALIRQPKELIHKLYQHPSVLENCVGQKDINSTCDEIAAIHGLNVLEIRQSLLDKWLLGVSSLADDPDQTMTFGNVCDLSNEKEDLDRVLYVLSSRDRMTCLKYLADYFHMMVVHPQAEKRILYCLLKCGADKETDMFDHLLGLDTPKIDS